MKKIVLLCSVLLILSCNSLEKYNQAILNPQSVEALHKDVDKTYLKLQRAHPKLYQYISKERLDAKFDSLKSTITKPLTSKQFYKKLAPVVKTIGQGHISVVLPLEKRDKETRKLYRDKKFNFNSLQYSYVESKLFVKAAKDKDTLLIGAEVLKLDTTTPQELVKEYNKYIASDGYNTTLFDAFIGHRFLRYYYTENGFQDSIQVTFKQNDSVFSKMFRWEKKQPKKDTTKADSIQPISKRKLSKAEKKIRKDSIKKLYTKRYVYGYVPNREYYMRDFNFIGTDSTVAYMKIRGFTGNGYKDFYEQQFKILDSLQTKNLIIDLRNNGGGSLNEIRTLYSYLTNKEYVFLNKSEVTTRTPFLTSFMANKSPAVMKIFSTLFSPIIAVHNLIKTHKDEGKLYYKFKGTKPEEPKKNNYKGAIYVLINGNSFSASSLLSTHLKATNRATFVGQETGGAYNGTVAGLFKDYELPNSKILIHMGLMQVETPHKIDPDGYGVKPDITIIPTISDTKNEVDAAIDWVLQDVVSKQ